MTMSDARLDTILESYGAAPERWPAEQRADALALLDGSDRARRRWVEAAALDLLLQRDPAPEPSADLVRRLRATPSDTVAEPPRRKTRPALFGILNPVRMPAAGAFAAIVLAFLVGLALPAPFGDTAPAPAILATTGADDAVFIETASESGSSIVDDWTVEASSVGEDGEIDYPELAVLDLALD